VIGNFVISVIAGNRHLHRSDDPQRCHSRFRSSVLMAFLDLIPLVGATIGGVGIGIVAAIANFPTAVIVWAIYFIVYQQVREQRPAADHLPPHRPNAPTARPGRGADRRQPAGRARSADRHPRSRRRADRRERTVENEARPISEPESEPPPPSPPPPPHGDIATELP